MLAALVGHVVELARSSVVWPFEVFVAVLAGSFLAGLVIYRTRGAGAADGPDREHEERSQVSS